MKTTSTYNKKKNLMNIDAVRHLNELTGTFISNARGFGFVEVEGREQDLFIPAWQTVCARSSQRKNERRLTMSVRYFRA